MISLRLKGKWSIRQRQGFHSNSDGIIYSLLLLMQISIGITLHSCYGGKSFRPQRGRIVKGSQVLHFWQLMPKGEKVLSPKQKDRTTISKFSKKLKEEIISIGISVSLKIFNWYLIWFQNFN
jgi:hypothetical protein